MPAQADEQLLRALYEQHGAALYGYALRLTGGDRAWAQDVVQEVLLRAWRHPRVFEAGPIRGWLHTVARNLVIDQWRARQVRPEVLTEPPDRGVADGTDEAVQSWLVADALRRLSSAHREVLVECYYLGRSTVEAAERLGVPAGTVKSRLHYALKALRLALEEMGVV